MVEFSNDFATIIFLFLLGSCISFLGAGLHHRSKKNNYAKEFFYGAGLTGVLGFCMVYLFSDGIMDSKLIASFKDPFFWLFLIIGISIAVCIVYIINTESFIKERKKNDMENEIKYKDKESLIKAFEDYSGFSIDRKEVDTREKLLSKFHEIHQFLIDEVNEYCNDFCRQADWITDKTQNKQ